MRIALAADGPLGVRAGRVLLADRRITALGILGSTATSRDLRVERIDSLHGWPVLVTDHPPADVPVGSSDLITVTQHVAADFPLKGRRVLAASPDSGLPAALAAVLAPSFDEVLDMSATYTIAGRPLRRGTPAGFPDPVGPLWSESVPNPTNQPPGLHFRQAPHEGQLEGLLVEVTGRIDGSPRSRVQAVVDDPRFLAGITLAAGALMLIDGELPTSSIEVEERASDYVRACTEAGLVVAEFNSES